MFELIDASRTESARLGRQFFDSQHNKHLGGILPNVNLPAYRSEWLAESLQEQKTSFQQEDTPETAITEASEVAIREVENGGRQTIIQGVEGSPRARWARVLTGDENCAFCVMLASRGADFRSQESAGGISSRTFHKGCDCKVVPVFNSDDWPGRDQYLQADKIYRNASQGVSGQKATLRAMRRYLKDNPQELDSVRAA